MSILAINLSKIENIFGLYFGFFLAIRLLMPDIAIAAPENIIPSSEPKIDPPQQLPIEDFFSPDAFPSENSESQDKTSELNIDLENIEIKFKQEQDNFGKNNQFITKDINFSLENADKLKFTTGYNTFLKTGTEQVVNIPLLATWRKNAKDFNLELTGGVEFFDRLPTDFTLKAKIERKINLNANEANKQSSFMVITGNFQREPYKFNAQSLQNEIVAWRFGPDLYWQITQNTSFFSSLRLGFYNDGNQEFQMFSRFEHKIEPFFVAVNLFNWSYQKNLESENGYFSPSNFYVFTGQLGVSHEILEPLTCGMVLTFGQQLLEDERNGLSGFNLDCNLDIAQDFSAKLGYSFSTLFNSSSNTSSYQNEIFSGQLSIKF